MEAPSAPTLIPTRMPTPTPELAVQPAQGYISEYSDVGYATVTFIRLSPGGCGGDAECYSGSVYSSTVDLDDADEQDYTRARRGTISGTPGSLVMDLGGSSQELECNPPDNGVLACRWFNSQTGEFAEWELTEASTADYNAVVARWKQEAAVLADERARVEQLREEAYSDCLPFGQALDQADPQIINADGDGPARDCADYVAAGLGLGEAQRLTCEARGGVDKGRSCDMAGTAVRYTASVSEKVVSACAPNGPKTSAWVDAEDQGYDGANLRSEPDINSHKKMMIPNGKQVEVAGRARDKESNTWSFVIYKDRCGYVLDSLLSHEHP